MEIVTILLALLSLVSYSGSLTRKIAHDTDQDWTMYLNVNVSPSSCHSLSAIFLTVNSRLNRIYPSATYV